MSFFVSFAAESFLFSVPDSTIFFLLPVLKSVSYQPEPFNLNEGADISFETDFLLHLGPVSYTHLRAHET